MPVPKAQRTRRRTPAAELRAFPASAPGGEMMGKADGCLTFATSLMGWQVVISIILEAVPAWFNCRFS